MAANLKDAYRRHYTLEEYFALEKVGDARYEYWDGDIVCMSGGTEQHTILSGNIFGELRNKLRGGKCQPYNEGMAILTPSLPPYRYPDVSVVCGEKNLQTLQGITVLVNPTLIVEVLSATTEKADRDPKKDAYQALSSVKEYLLVSQTAHHVTHFSRHREFWHRAEFSGLDAIIPLPSLGCELALRDIYEGVIFA
ncbi:MAG TPA: Uma2 family endonuclease [Blastocatellia bacterium]|nr:Uma2 family endonuclease [Blastocatellia bacterium]